MKKDKIIISICSRSFNNNLLILLNCIYKNWQFSNLNIKVLIIFNGSKKIQNLQKKLIQKSLKKIKYIIGFENRVGISYVRNRVLKKLKCLDYDYGCFLDDDCMIKKNFIVKHLNFIKRNNCQIVGGPQLYKSKKAFFRVFERNFLNDRYVSWVSTNNVFYLKSALDKNLYFSKNVTKYGYGEDQLFFSKLSNFKKTIRWNNNPVFEIAQKKRENIKWFMERNYKYGLTGILIDRELYGFISAIFLNIFKALLNLSRSFLYLLLIPFKPIVNFYFSFAYFLRFIGRVVNIFG